MNTVFEPTSEESASGFLSPEKLIAICNAIEHQGYAVVGNLISSESRQLLMDAMLEDVAKVKSLNKPTFHEQLTGTGHMQLGVRRYAPYVPPDLIANALVEHVVSGFLGDGAWLGFFNGNMNCPGSTFQPLHFDRPYAWKTEAQAIAAGQSWPPRSTTLSCSVALSEITVESGATEIYPGSHRETEVANWERGQRLENHPELIERWAPPASMTIPAGGVCFRDPRMWHRGVPNRSDRYRPMLAMTYHAKTANHWRGIVVDDLSEEAAAERAKAEYLRVMDDGTIGDGRLVFHHSAKEAIEAAPSLHGINRFARYVKPPYAVNHFVDAHLVGGAREVPDGKIEPVIE